MLRAKKKLEIPIKPLDKTESLCYNIITENNEGHGPKEVLMIEDVIVSLFQQVYGKYAQAKRRPLWTIGKFVQAEAHKDREGCYLSGPRMARFLEIEGYEAIGLLGDTMDISSAKVVRFDSLEDGVIWVSWCWGPCVPITVRKVGEQ